MNILEIKDIKKTFGKKDAAVHALRGVTAEIQENTMTAIMGKSGSGKSTLLNILGGLMAADEGSFTYAGKPVDTSSNRKLRKYRRDQVGFVVQYFALIDDLNVFENVALSLRYQGISRREIKKRVKETLKLLGIESKIKAYPNELSGGQQQRVAIARAIVKKPKLILADEPTGALDVKTSAEVMDIFRQLADTGNTIVIVTHDPKVAEACDDVIVMEDGKVVEQVS
ncbi:MAG: ABC transporter ATP-binding protein [Lachnospiraceae bacterium]|nr:ABC transporter ATP-binding protein [Lachnospiraceae bacterium]